MKKRKLKNWTITSESVKRGRDGLIKYYNYLRSTEGHEGQNISMLSNALALGALMVRPDNFNLQRKLSTGGRPSNYGWSSTISLPFEVDDDGFKKLSDILLDGFLDFLEEYLQKTNKAKAGYKFLENQRKNIKAQMVLFVHRGQDINNHLHMIFPTHYTVRTADNESKIISIDLTQKKFTHKLKELNNEAVNLLFGKSVNDYVIETADAVAKKRVNKEVYKALQAQNATKIISDLDKAKKRRDELLIAYYDHCEIMCVENIPEMDKHFNTLHKYLAKGWSDKANALMDKIEYKQQETVKTDSALIPQAPSTHAPARR